MNLLSPQNDIFNYIHNYETTLLQKKKRGVVFTNESTIHDMLKILPNDVWNNKDLKWLDPAVGIGNFMIIVYFKLMDGLKNVIICEESRRKHILENMIFMVEFNNDYIQSLKEIFLSDKYQLNIFHGSFVELHTLPENTPIFPENNFDIIIGNPPYQKENKINENKLSSKPLYHLFVERSVELLYENGYLLLIHPYSWRRKSKEIRMIHRLLENKILYMYTNNDFKDFNTSAPFINYYLLKKSPYDKNHKTIYHTSFNSGIFKGKLHLQKDLCFIPSFLTKETITIVTKMISKKGDKLNIKLESKLSTSKKPSNINKHKTDIFLYKNYHNFSTKHGDIYRYSSRKHPCHEKEKIIMNFKGGYKILNPFIDNGTLGVTDNSMFMIVTNDNKELILNFLKSKLLRFFLMTTTYNYGANQKNEFHIMNLITIPDKYNEEIDLYHFYQFTKKEIEFIETNII
jgi:hypothetical protein